MSFSTAPSAYGFDFDPDSDFDPEEKNPNKRMHWMLIIRASDP